MIETLKHKNRHENTEISETNDWNERSARIRSSVTTQHWLNALDRHAWPVVATDKQTTKNSGQKQIWSKKKKTQRTTKRTRSKKKKTPTNLLIRTLDTSNNLAGLQLTFVMLRAQMIHQHSSHIDERRVPARVGIWTRDSSIKRGNHRASRSRRRRERRGRWNYREHVLSRDWWWSYSRRLTWVSSANGRGRSLTDKSWMHRSSKVLIQTNQDNHLPTQPNIYTFEPFKNTTIC